MSTPSKNLEHNASRERTSRSQTNANRKASGNAVRSSLKFALVLGLVESFDEFQRKVRHMFVSTLKQLSTHPAVAEIQRKRGSVTVVLNTAAGWQHFDGGDLVVGKNAAEVVAQFNADKVCRSADLARAPKEIVFPVKNLRGDDGTFMTARVRAKLVGVSESTASFEAVEVVEIHNVPAWDKTDYSKLKCGVALRELEENPTRYGLAKKSVEPKFRNPASGHEIDCACAECARATPYSIREVAAFRDFYRSAHETDEKSADDIGELQPGEVCVRFDGDLFAVKSADGRYFTIIGNCEYVGTLEEVARPLFDFAVGEGVVEVSR